MFDPHCYIMFHWVNVQQFIYILGAHEYLSNFSFGAVVNNAVMNMSLVEHMRCRCIYLGTISLLLRVCTCVAGVYMTSLPYDMHK